MHHFYGDGTVYSASCCNFRSNSKQASKQTNKPTTVLASKEEFGEDTVAKITAFEVWEIFLDVFTHIFIHHLNQLKSRET